jgi:hypothetical protein
MKITLIQSGGFTGKAKIAEEELSNYPEALQQLIKQAFLKKPLSKEPVSRDMSRDKESYSLELNGANLPLDALPRNDDLDELIRKMKSNLKYKKN